MCELKGSWRSSLLRDTGLGDLPDMPVSQAWSPMVSLGRALPSDFPHPPGTHCTTNFDGEILGHHAVAGCQVTVHKLLGSKVGHAVCNLPCHLNHVTECRLREARVVLQWDRGAGEGLPHTHTVPSSSQLPSITRLRAFLIPTSASGLRDRRWLLRSPRVINSMMTRVGWP